MREFRGIGQSVRRNSHAQRSPAACLLGYVELEPGPSETYRLPDRLDVCRLEHEQDAQPAQHDLVTKVRRQEAHLEPCELCSVLGERRDQDAMPMTKEMCAMHLVR
jgi:hypothetical protein